jgi:hypothetical protein
MNALISRTFFILGLLVLIASPVRSDDFGFSVNQDNPLVKKTKDHRVKVTLLYAGKGANGSSQFVVVCLLEVARTHGQLVHDAVPGATGSTDDGNDPNATVWCRGISLKDSTDTAKKRGGYNSTLFTEWGNSPLAKRLPPIKMPDVENPAFARIYTAYFQAAPDSPFDVLVWAVRQGWYSDERDGTVVFSGIKSDTFPSP